MCKLSERIAGWFKLLRRPSASNGASTAAGSRADTRSSTAMGATPCARLAGVKLLSLTPPFLIAALMIAVQYAQNVGEAEPLTALRLLSMASAATGVLLVLARLATRSWIQAALVVSIFNVLFFVYGRVYGVLLYQQKLVAMQPATWHAALLSLSLGIVAVAAVLIRQSRRDWWPLSKFLTSVLTIVLTITVWNIASGERQNAEQFSQTVEPNVPSAKDYVAAKHIQTDSEETPDVYYIILDAYVRADVLKNVFGRDNSPFVDGLKSRGFYVGEDSCSNYPFTFMSLCSSLSMRYLDPEIAAANASGHPSKRPFNNLTHNALAAKIFQSKGYRYVHIASNVSMTQTSDIADTIWGYHPSWLQNEFTQVLFRTTALRLFEPSLAQIHLNAFERLKEVPKIAGPTFTFAHIVCPHRPIVFNCDGAILANQPQDLARGNERVAAFRDGYVGQLQYVNKRITEVVDSILAQSKTPPIIIIHGDHGSATLGQCTTSQPIKNFDIVCRERLPILNAYLVPEKMREKLYPTISPVNTFRMLLTECFGEKFSLLPDRSVMGWYDNPFNLKDVTEWVHSQGAPNAEEVHLASQPLKKVKTTKQAKKAGSTKRA